MNLPGLDAPFPQSAPACALNGIRLIKKQSLSYTALAAGIHRHDSESTHMSVKPPSRGRAPDARVALVVKSHGNVTCHLSFFAYCTTTLIVKHQHSSPDARRDPTR